MMDVPYLFFGEDRHMSQTDDNSLPDDLPLDDVDIEGDEDEDEKDEAGSNNPDDLEPEGDQ
jgi:hypothetical protein